MLKGEHTSADQRLSEFVAEIAGAVGCFDQDLFGGLVEPLPGFKALLPGSAGRHPGIRSHINGGAGQRDTGFATGHPVADLSAGTGGSAVKRLDGRREIMRFGFQRNHCVDRPDAEKIGLVLRLRGKFLCCRSADKGYIIFIS